MHALTRHRTSSRKTAPAWPVRGRPWKADGMHRPSWWPCARGVVTAEVHDYHDERTGVLAAALAKRAPGYIGLGFPTRAGSHSGQALAPATNRPALAAQYYIDMISCLCNATAIRRYLT
jgi:hypothetical protein